MMQQMEMLRARRSDLNQRLNNIDTVTAEQWEEFRNSTEQTLDDLDNVLNSMEDELEDMRQGTEEMMQGQPGTQGGQQQNR
jgi:prefoldin subunit 5